MGACCFTPRRTQFLWWYWLVLASIVGIPMLIAAMYVARFRDDNDALRQRAGRRATWIFVTGALVVAVLAIVAGHSTTVALLGDQEGNYFRGLVYITMTYVGGVSLLISLDSWLKRGMTFSRLLLVIALIALAAFSLLPMGPADTVFGTGMVNPQQMSLMFLVCFLPAFFFRKFGLSLTRRAAVKALIAAVAGALLVWGIAEYGRVVNLYAYWFSSGTPPYRAEVSFFSQY